MKYIYLAGPITGVADEARAWRIQAARHFPVHWEAIDPLVIEAKTLDPASIVQLDYSWIERSDGILVNVNRPSWGTAMELAYAKPLGKPVVAFAAAFAFALDSPWLVYHVDSIQPTLVQAIDRLKEILQ